MRDQILWVCHASASLAGREPTRPRSHPREPLPHLWHFVHFWGGMSQKTLEEKRAPPGAEFHTRGEIAQEGRKLSRLDPGCLFGVDRGSQAILARLSMEVTTEQTLNRLSPKHGGGALPLAPRYEGADRPLCRHHVSLLVRSPPQRHSAQSSSARNACSGDRTT
jgi:hypothetical protein